MSEVQTGALLYVQEGQVAEQARYVLEQEKELKRLPAIIAFGDLFHYLEFKREADAVVRNMFRKDPTYNPPSSSSNTSGTSSSAPSSDDSEEDSGPSYWPKATALSQLFKGAEGPKCVRVGTPEGDLAFSLIRSRIKILHRDMFEAVGVELDDDDVAAMETEDFPDAEGSSDEEGTVG